MAELGKKLDVYEQILSKQKYLAGDEVTLADLFHLPYAELLPKAGAKVFEERPNVSR
jgi:glutathione S-transferase